jgi:hypothetical protein|tara:strand:+ start:329 stop:520 length:192 start_codon:yes stop_codon:yes gene_type:complete
MLSMAYKMRRHNGKLEVYHRRHGWVEALNIKADEVKIRRYDARDGGFITYNEPHENFRLTGEA